MKTGTGTGVLSAIDGNRLELGRGQPVSGGATYRCWRRLREADGIEWLILDQTDASTNRIEPAMLEELDAVLAELERDRPPGLVLRSAKPNGFVAGADIAQFRGVGDAGAMAAVLGRGHAVFDRLAALPIPNVAVIHGFCLGGGLELALACRRRIARANASLGFPEVQLGLHPGLGGTARLTRLIDPLDAMSMMLTGRPKNARAALRAGLVDAVTEERHVAAAVRAAISGALKPRRSWFKTAAFNTLPVRRLAGNRMRAEAQKRARPEHYPAPGALIDLWEKHGGGEGALKAAEIPSFSHLLVGETAQNLIRIFFLRQAMGKADKSAHPIRHVHVIGAGAMGGDIAAWCAYKGLRVTLADMSLKALGGAMKRAGDLFAYHYRDRHDRAKLRDAFDRLIPDPKGAGVGAADLIIEAVPENLDLKRKIFAGLEPKMKPGAILATNTSSIRIEDLRQGLQHPERLVGIHFFNPVSRMPLIEVVSHDQAAPEALASARAFAARIDRVAAPVKSAPGFLVNRTLMPYLLEALLMIDEKTAPETIDQAAERFGMPMGPIELADHVGLDICLDVARVLSQGLSEPLPKAPDWLEAKVKQGELGRKSGKGIYDYKNGKPQKKPGQPAPDAEMTDRLILPLLNACAACLREGVVADEDTVDGALVFGAGFAPFRGGPLRYARKRGIAEVTAALERLAEKHGARFKPDPFWQKLGA